MSRNPEALQTWITLALAIAAICTTTLPLLYAFSTKMWYRTAMGRAFMAQSVALALAIDLTLLLRFWDDRPLYSGRILTALVLTLVATTSAGLTLLVWRYNFHHEETEESHEELLEQREL